MVVSFKTVFLLLRRAEAYMKKWKFIKIKRFSDLKLKTQKKNHNLYFFIAASKPIDYICVYAVRKIIFL